MRHRSLPWLLVLALLVALGGCPGGGGAVGDSCSGNGDCASTLQCVAGACVPRCQRAPECGDGYACDANGLCQAATGQQGDACTSEVDCVSGLACELTGVDDSDHLIASCVAENAGSPEAATCTTDAECRNGTCAIGHCVDLCRDTRDCGAGTSCALIPRVCPEATSCSTPIPPAAVGAMFGGCLQSHGALSWPIPIHGASETVLLPIPDSARSVAVTFTVDDSNQKVGATHVSDPSGTVVVGGSYYTDPVRHQPEYGQSTLVMPSSPSTPLQPGAYAMTVKSLRLGNIDGSATPTATAVIKVDASVLLDLHFYFLDFDDHPCSDQFGGSIDATVAQTATFFQTDFLGQLRSLFAQGGIALGTMTYEDLREHPDLDGLDVDNAGSLLALGAHDIGINVFFVRTLSPVGLQAFGPNPGPAGLPGTRGSGIIVGLDTLCYRTWSQVARQTAHELARYMGLYDNVELDVALSPDHVDPIVDDDTDMPSANLMFYSELGGADLSPGQRDVLSRSAVLR